MVKVKMYCTVLSLMLLVSAGIAWGQVPYDPPGMIEPELPDYSNMGYVRVVVYIDEGLVAPKQDAGVFLLNQDYSIVEYKLTDQTGETDFLATAGTYIVRAHIDLDHKDYVIELPAGSSIETLHFLFSYNPSSDGVAVMDTSSSSSESLIPTEPDCPGIVPVTTMEDSGGFYTLLPGVEVEIIFPSGMICRMAVTDVFGRATFVVEEGLYHVSCKYGSEIRSRWIYVFCSRTIDPLTFIF